MYEQIQKIFKVLTDNNHEVYIVGGAVRDIVMGVKPHDYDFTSSALPNQVVDLFVSQGYKVIPTGIEHGTVTVLVDDISFEVTTYRIDASCDGRHCEVQFVRSLEEDIKRRDITINALAMNKDNNIIDLVNGLDDIKNKIIRTVGDPEQRFKEDYLRILRVIRFFTKLNFSIHPDTYRAILKLYQNLSKISRERIRDEFNEIIQSSNRVKGLTTLYDTGIIDLIVPKFSELAYIAQPKEFHPEGDVLVHTMLAMSNIEEGDSLELTLATLLHDIGKPEAYSWNIEKQRITFKGHETISAEKSKAILHDLKYDNDMIDKVHFIILNHMIFHKDDIMKLKKSTIKKLILMKVGEKYVPNPLFDDLVKLYKYDVLASDRDLTNYFNLLRRVSEIREEIKKEPPVRLITGHDVMKLGIKPGPIISEILEEIEDAYMEGKKVNGQTMKTREQALEYLKTIVNV